MAGRRRSGEKGEKRCLRKKAIVKAKLVLWKALVCDEGGGEVDVILEYVNTVRFRCKDKICNGQSCYAYLYVCCEPMTKQNRTLNQKLKARVKSSPR